MNEMYKDTITELPERIREEYQVLSCLKHKEDIRIYLVSSVCDGKKYILKCAKNEYSDRLKNEEKIISIIDEQCFPQIHNVFVEDGILYYVRTYIEGETLFDYVEKNGPFNRKEVLDIMIQVSNIIEKLHMSQNPIICRDIKAQNIIRTPEGKYALIDLDVARLYKDKAEYDTVYLGTKETASPEQFGYGQTDLRTDIYGMGMLMIYLCSGEIKRDGIKNIKSPGIKKVILKCIKFDPEKRYQTIVALKTELVCLRRLGIRRKSSIVTLVLLCALVGVGVTLGLMKNYKEDSPVEKIVDFDSETLEEYVRKVLKKDAEEPIFEYELEQVTSIVICGDRYFDSFSQYSDYRANYWYEWDEMSPATTPVTQADIDKFKNITMLALDNQGYVEMPDVSHLKLYKLSLCKNEISDISGLKSQSGIAVLWLAETRVRDVSCLVNMKSLYELDLTSADTSDLTCLEGLNIEIIKCAECGVYDYSFLRELPHLTELHITTGSEEIVGWIGELENHEKLKFIAITESYFTNLEGISKLTSLEGIELSGTVRLKDLEGIDKLKRLTYLGISNTGITEFPESIKDSTIRILDMKGVYVEDATILNECIYLSQVYVSEDMLEHYESQLEDYIQVIGY